MALRDEWEFEYTSAALAKGALKQREFRLGRVAWWKAKKDAVMNEIRESGIEVSESLAADLSNYASKALRGPQVMVRADLQEKLTECHSKIQGHQRLADEFEAWAAMLEEHPEARVKLHRQDWQFFFGKGD